MFGQQPLVVGAPRRAMRRGLSMLEFVACFGALTGGVILGSVYLGIDVKQAALVALERAQAVATVQPRKPDATPDGPGAAPAAAGTSTADSAAAADEQAAASALAELEPPAAPPTLTESLSLTPAQREELTRAYWSALDAYMRAEATGRRNNFNGQDNADLYAYLSSRHDGHQQAAVAIARLSSHGVDAHVMAYAEMAQAWHDSGAKLYARAKDLLTDAPTAKANGPLAQNWQSAATQHQMEEQLLAEKHRAVQFYLDHDLGQPRQSPAEQDER
jgi:hypothetical protein